MCMKPQYNGQRLTHTYVFCGWLRVIEFGSDLGAKAKYFWPMRGGCSRQIPVYVQIFVYYLL